MNACIRLWQPIGWRWLTTVSQFVASWHNGWLTGLGNQRQITRLSTHSRPASILFTDIAGFSARMATQPQAEVVTHLDHYFQILSRCVQQHNGQVDKFIGDGMMAVFDNPDDAVRAARAIQCEVAHFNADQLARRRCVFPTRIAVDSGPVIATHLSARPNQGKTVFGRAVNLAAHLVQQAPLNRTFISQNTWNQLADGFECRRERLVVVKGEQEPITVYEL